MGDVGAVGLLTGLGFYVYMGAKAESLLIKSKKDERKHRLAVKKTLVCLLL